MGRLLVTEFVTLDGVMEDPGGVEGFKYGGWSFQIRRGDEGDKFKLDETLNSNVLLLGRKTYEGFAKAWPKIEGEFGDKFNNMPKYVVSSTLKSADWKNSTILNGDVKEVVSKLKQDVKGTIAVHGSAQLVQTLLEFDLVDMLNIMIYPIILGSGKRLFSVTSHNKAWKLDKSQVVGDGVVILTYSAKK